MIKAALALVLIACASPSAAGDFERCSKLQSIAVKMMERRQSGVPIMESMAFHKDFRERGGSPEFADFMDELLLMAYRRPLSETERGAEVEAIRFGEEVLNACMAG